MAKMMEHIQTRIESITLYHLRRCHLEGVRFTRYWKESTSLYTRKCRPCIVLGDINLVSVESHHWISVSAISYNRSKEIILYHFNILKPTLDTILSAIRFCLLEFLFGVELKARIFNKPIY